MSLLEKIKGLFGKTALPEETKVLLSGVGDVDELRRGLDEIATRNEVEARDIEREIEKLARMEAAQKERIGGGDLNKREKTNILREIKRLRRRMDSLEKRHRIHQDNIDLHMGLFDRITEMQAMEMKAVSQKQIEELSADYDESLESHRDLIATGKAASGMEDLYEDSAEQAELAALEAEILAELGDKEEPDDEVELDEEPAKEPDTKEPAATEPAERTPVEAAARKRSLGEELARLEAAEQQVDSEDERALELE